MLAGTVADCALLLRTVAGHDTEDPVTSRRTVPDYLAENEQGIDGLHIAVPENYFYDPVVPEVRALLDQSLDLYCSLGARVVPVTHPSIELANPLVDLIIAVEGAEPHQRWSQACPDDYGKQTLGRLLPGLVYPVTQYLGALNLR